MAVLIAERWLALCRRRFSDCFARFFDCAVLAKVKDPENGRKMSGVLCRVGCFLSNTDLAFLVPRIVEGGLR